MSTCSVPPLPPDVVDGGEGNDGGDDDDDGDMRPLCPRCGEPMRHVFGEVWFCATQGVTRLVRVYGSPKLTPEDMDRRRNDFVEQAVRSLLAQRDIIARLRERLNDATPVDW